MYTLKTPYSEYSVYLSKGKYPNGRTSIKLIDAEDGCPVMTATTNVPEVELAENEIIIKNYSENEGVLEFLQENGIVGEVKRTIGVGFVSAPVVELLS
jgi:hypothetical protein